jgi:hypothetical protein
LLVTFDDFENFLPLPLQVNRVGVIIPINIPHKSNQTSGRNGRLHGLSLVTKAKMAVEGDVLEKGSVSSNDKGGNSSFHIPLLLFHHLIVCSKMYRLRNSKR